MKKNFFVWLTILLIIIFFIVVNSSAMAFNPSIQILPGSSKPIKILKPLTKTNKVLADKILIIPEVSAQEIIIICRKNYFLAAETISLSEEILKVLKGFYAMFIHKRAQLDSLVSYGDLSEEELKKVGQEKEEIERLISMCEDDLIIMRLIKQGCQKQINLYVYIALLTINGEQREKWPSWLEELRKHNQKLKEIIRIITSQEETEEEGKWKQSF